MVLHPGFGNQQRGSIPTPSTIKAHTANIKRDLNVAGSTPVSPFRQVAQWVERKNFKCAQFYSRVVQRPVHAALTRKVKDRHLPRLPKRRIVMKETHCIAGCTYRINTKEDLDRVLQTDCFLLIKTYWEIRPWWKIVFKRKVLYYEVMCINSVTISLGNGR